MRIVVLWIAVAIVLGGLAYKGMQYQTSPEPSRTGHDPSENCPYVGPGGC